MGRGRAGAGGGGGWGARRGRGGGDAGDAAGNFAEGNVRTRGGGGEVRAVIGVFRRGVRGAEGLLQMLKGDDLRAGWGAMP